MTGTAAPAFGFFYSKFLEFWQNYDFWACFCQKSMVEYPYLDEEVMVMKRRTLTIVLLIAMLASMLIVPVSASAAVKVKILSVTVDAARIRQGPSKAYDVITTMKKGSKVFYLNKIQNHFAYICTSKGIKGYMYKGFLKNYGVTYSNQIYRCKVDYAFVYQKKSTGSARMGILTKNQHVIVYMVSGNWAYIKTLSGWGGYVKKSVLTKAK